MQKVAQGAKRYSGSVVSRWEPDRIERLLDTDAPDGRQHYAGGVARVRVPLGRRCGVREQRFRRGRADRRSSARSRTSLARPWRSRSAVRSRGPIESSCGAEQGGHHHDGKRHCKTNCCGAACTIAVLSTPAFQVSRVEVSSVLTGFFVAPLSGMDPSGLKRPPRTPSIA